MANIERKSPSAPDELTAHESPDQLTGEAHAAGVWSLPSAEGISQDDPHVPAGVDYSAGMFVGGGPEFASANPMPLAPEHWVGARVDAPHSFELPHEATHRRYEPPQIVSISQAAAGFTLIAPGRGLHFVKVIALTLTLDAAGTLKFVQGANDGTVTGDMTGTLNMGGAATAPLILPPADLQNPWLYTSPDLGFGIFTATGKAQGWAVIAFSPYDQ